MTVPNEYPEHRHKRRRYSNEEIIRRARQGLALNLRELAIAMGYGYSTVQKWHKHGLPLVDGRISLEEAKVWLVAYGEAQRATKPRIDVSHHPLLTNDRTRSTETGQKGKP